jgi:hypothetical protein
MELKIKMRLALGLLLATPALAQANHALVNCGAPGYWDKATPETPLNKSYYVWLMNDDTVQLQLPGQNWIQLGEVKGPNGLSIDDVNISELAKEMEFAGPNFVMKIGDEIIRSRRQPNRRYFRAEFKTHLTQGPLECVFGLK